MVVYKSSAEFNKVKIFSGIIFDCDGVLIDATQSYDLAIVECAKAFGSVLGLDFEPNDFTAAIAQIRELGTFNNDWDSLAVMASYLYSKAKSTRRLDAISHIFPLGERLKSFEYEVVQKKNEKRTRIGFEDLFRTVSRAPEGTSRDQLIEAILRDDLLLERVSQVITYPKPVGQGFLSTLFDEVVYGKQVFREMYGFDCVTTDLSNPGLIVNEKKLVNEGALVSFFSASNGNLGIITGRPRVPTLFTMSESFRKWFTRPEICLFTGDYILDVAEVKPSPRPMLKIGEKLSHEHPILYVGDSGEDLLMTKNVNSSRKLENKVYFAGIASSEERARFFESEKGYVDCVVSDVNELGSLLEEYAS